MIKFNNLITDVPGIKVGNAHDANVRTGVTVLLPDTQVVAGVDVRGGAPGTREVSLLSPSCLAHDSFAIVLSGGSLFGLDAASGVMHWLREKKRGSIFFDACIPTVPSAILFDLRNGGDKSWADEYLYSKLGKQAADNASEIFELGNSGAGFGATAGGIKGGLGSTSQVAGNGAIVGALVATNSFGSTTMGDSARFWASDHEHNNEFGGAKAYDGPLPIKTNIPFDDAEAGANTTLGIVATDMELTKAQAQRIAMIAHDGYAKSIHPVHSPFDGDIIFVVSTGKIPMTDPSVDVTYLGLAAAECIARAATRGVYEAKSLGEVLSYKEMFNLD